MRRQFPSRPILCVGGIVIDSDRVVLVKRRHEPQRGEWTIPGGAVELKERIQSAVRREVREETGLVVEPLKLVMVLERIIRKKGRVQYHYVVLDYACQLKHGHITPASDVLDARWVLRSDIPKYRLRKAASDIIQQSFQLFQSTK